MCFFKPKIPQQPVPPTKPTIQETKAPEPESLAIGGSEGAPATEGTVRARGTGSLTIDLKESGDANTQSGANRGLSSGTKPKKKPVTVKPYSKGPVIT